MSRHRPKNIREMDVILPHDALRLGWRSTPGRFGDCDHVIDNQGKLWCYSQPCDTWGLRDGPTTASAIAPYSYRSWHRLEAERGPLHRLLHAPEE